MVQLAYSECQNRDIKNPSQKKPHTTHTQSTHPHVCASHMGEGRQGIRQWNLLFAVEHLSASYLSFILETF